MSFIHGAARTPQLTKEYRAWKNAKTRCFNPNCEFFKYYGGRGITMCDKWRASFSEFLKDMGLCPPGLTLGRIDNDGNYEPGNCRWESMKSQALNTRRSHIITFRGKSQTLFEWANELGVSYGMLKCRLGKHGWSIQEALTIPKTSPGLPRPKMKIKRGQNGQFLKSERALKL